MPRSQRAAQLLVRAIQTLDAEEQPIVLEALLTGSIGGSRCGPLRLSPARSPVRCPTSSDGATTHCSATGGPARPASRLGNG